MMEQNDGPLGQWPVDRERKRDGIVTGKLGKTP